jgi:hypothetical protein
MLIYFAGLTIPGEFGCDTMRRSPLPGIGKLVGPINDEDLLRKNNDLILLCYLYLHLRPRHHQLPRYSNLDLTSALPLLPRASMPVVPCHISGR